MPIATNPRTQATGHISDDQVSLYLSYGYQITPDDTSGGGVAIDPAAAQQAALIKFLLDAGMLQVNQQTAATGQYGQETTRLNTLGTLYASLVNRPENFATLANLERGQTTGGPLTFLNTLSGLADPGTGGPPRVRTDFTPADARGDVSNLVNSLIGGTGAGKAPAPPTPAPDKTSAETTLGTGVDHGAGSVPGPTDARGGTPTMDWGPSDFGGKRPTKVEAITSGMYSGGVKVSYGPGDQYTLYPANHVVSQDYKRAVAADPTFGGWLKGSATANTTGGQSYTSAPSGQVYGTVTESDVQHSGGGGHPGQSEFERRRDKLVKQFGAKSHDDLVQQVRDRTGNQNLSSNELNRALKHGDPTTRAKAVNDFMSGKGGTLNRMASGGSVTVADPTAIGTSGEMVSSATPPSDAMVQSLLPHGQSSDPLTTGDMADPALAGDVPPGQIGQGVLDPTNPQQPPEALAEIAAILSTPPSRQDGPLETAVRANWALDPSTGTPQFVGTAAGGAAAAIHAAQGGTFVVRNPTHFTVGGQPFLTGEHGHDELVSIAPGGGGVRVQVNPLQNPRIPVPAWIARLANSLVDGSPYHSTIRAASGYSGTVYGSGPAAVIAPGATITPANKIVNGGQISATGQVTAPSAKHPGKSVTLPYFETVSYPDPRHTASSYVANLSPLEKSLLNSTLQAMGAGDLNEWMFLNAQASPTGQRAPLATSWRRAF